MRLVGSAFWFGRAEGCALVLDSELVSRKHAVFSLEPGGWFVRDHKSSNGTFVNGRKVAVVALALGDEVRFGEAGPSLRILGLDLGGSEVTDLEATRLAFPKTPTQPPAPPAPKTPAPKPQDPKPPKSKAPQPKPPARLELEKPSPPKPTPPHPALDVPIFESAQPQPPPPESTPENLTRPMPSKMRARKPNDAPVVVSLGENATMPLPPREEPSSVGPWGALLGLFLGATTGLAAWGDSFPYRAVAAPVFRATTFLENQFATFMAPRVGWTLIAGLALYGCVWGVGLQRIRKRWPLLLTLAAAHGAALVL